jgi:hypothetical protein
MRTFASLAGMAVAGITAFVGLGFAGDDPGPVPEHPAIQYATRPVHDAISGLNRKLRTGTARLNYNDANGYLRPLLDALGIPVESQIAVYSKTSFQARSVSPWNPRTIFFNDSVAVAWVRGEWTVEAAAEDPQQGVIFYQIDQRNQTTPQFRREDDCLSCHLRDTGPGTIVRSVAVSPDGGVLARLANFSTDETSPIAERWGGWYVTGTSGGMPHLGNMTFDPGAAELPSISAPRELTSLEGKIDTGVYLSRYSDIVALMVFEHQMRAVNLITQAGWVARWAAAQPEPPVGRVRDAANQLADYLLFANEPRLTGQIIGSSGFAEKFAARGPRDKRGRSLRQFDLRNRLMRYPCSYMIYSEAFDILSENAKSYVYERMWKILSGKERKGFENLSAEDRRAIVQILRDTKPGLPAYFE